MVDRYSIRRRAAAAAILWPLFAAAQHDIEEIQVTGVPRSQSPADLAQSVTVLRDDTLNRIRSSSIGETLSGQLGVNATYFGSGASRPIIRGLAGPRVKTLEDGIDSLDVASVSVDHAVGVDPLAADQIEIFRGPTTLLYGSGAVGGVINTVTNRIPAYAPDDGFEGAFELRGDSVSNERAGALRLDGGGQSFAWHVDAHRSRTDDYDIPGFAELDEHGDEDHADEDENEHDLDEEAVPGSLENSDVEIDSLAVGGSWLMDRGYVGVSIGRFETNYGLPGHSHGPEDEHDEEAVRIDLKQTRIGLEGGWAGLSGGIEAISFRVGINEYEHVELEGEEIGTLFENDAYEGRIELMHAPWGAWNGAFGLQFGQREFSAIGAEAFVPPVDTTSYGIFMIERREMELWDVSFGARLETVEQAPTGGPPRRDHSAASVSVAAMRDLGSRHAFVVNTAVAERAPVAEELYADGPHLATGNIEVGDPGIGVETSRHIDIGLRKLRGDMTWSVTAFLTRYDDFIYLRATGVEDPVEELPVFLFSQQDAELRGIEAEVFTPIMNFGDDGELDLRLFADYVRGELGNGDRLPRMPPLRYGARLQYHDDRLLAGLEATRHSEQDATAPFEEPTAGYTMLNADLSWTFGADLSSELELFVRGHNLLDKEARRHTSLVKELAPLPGRNFSVGLRTRF